MTDLFKLKMNESPFPQAMDIYYDQLDALVNAQGGSKLALTSNLVEFPLREETPLYNSYVSRAFADRAVKEGSPATLKERFMGPVNTNDRFSSQFGVLLNRAVAQIDTNLDQGARNRIDEARGEIRVVEEKLDQVIKEVLEEWEEHKKQFLSGLSDKEIEMRMVAWFDIHRLRRRVFSLNMEIDRWLTVQETTIEGAGTPEDAQIYRTYNAWRNSRVALPKDPKTEIDYELDVVKIGNFLLTGRNPSWADMGAEVDALADWHSILNLTGSRKFTIDRNSASIDTHEKKWSASASFRYGWFFSARISASEHTKMQNALSDSLSLGMSYQRISEIWIRRGNWYDSSLFGLPKIEKILKNDQKLAANLKYSVSALIVGRGLDFSLQFASNEHYSYFRSFSASGSAKFLNIIPFGSGSVNETTTKLRTDDKSKAVSFLDDNKVCRLLGFKFDTMHNLIDDQEILEKNGIFVSSDRLEAHIRDAFNVPSATKLML